MTADPANFDAVAEDYHLAVPPIPAAFVNWLIQEARLQPGARVLELGCGSGQLALMLAARNLQITGVDCSGSLLQLAKAKDKASTVRWIQARAEDFREPPNSVDMVLSFEAFHLFHDKVTILRSAADQLRRSGSLCVCWCEYHWESYVHEAIVSAFANVGIEWGTWGYQACVGLDRMVSAADRRFGRVRILSCSVQTTVRSETAANYVAAIGKASSLPPAHRASLKKELNASFCNVMGSESAGASRYYIAISQIGRDQTDLT